MTLIPQTINLIFYSMIYFLIEPISPRDHKTPTQIVTLVGIILIKTLQVLPTLIQELLAFFCCCS